MRRSLVGRTRARRLLTKLGSVLSAVGLTALFGVAASTALFLHLDLPASRRAVASVLSSTLAGVFHGHVSIGSITKLSSFQVEASDIVVRDEEQRVVLKVSRLTAQADLLDILKRVLLTSEKLTIVIGHVRVERAEATIIPGEGGVPTIAEALTPHGSEEGTSSSQPGRYVRVWLPHVEIGHAFARGSLFNSPVLEAEVTGAHGSVLASPKGAAIDVTRFALLARGIGGTDAKGIASLHVRAPGAVWSSFDGYMGDVQFGSVVRWENDVLDLGLDVPRAAPAAMRALITQWPLQVDTEARVTLKGIPPELEVEAKAKVGQASSLFSRGTLSLKDALKLQLDVEGRGLDLRSIWPQAPATSIDVNTELGVHTDTGSLVVEVGGGLQPTRIASLDVPAIDFSGAQEHGTFKGEAVVHDHGLPINLGFTLHPDGKLELNAEAKRVDLAKAERLKPYFSGRGNADIRVRLALDRGQLDSDLTLDLRGVEYEGVSLASGRVTASAKGAADRWDQLAIDAKLSGRNLRAGRFGFEAVEATARGPLLHPAVSAKLSDPRGPSVDAKAKLTIGEKLSLRELGIGVSRDNVAIRGDVAQLDFSEGRVLIRDLQLHGASGELSGNAELTPRTFNVSAQGQNLDLSAISRILGLPRGTLEGRASLAVNAVSSGNSQKGQLEVSLNKASIAGLNGIAGQLSAQLDGRQLSGSSTGRIEALGAFSATWDTELAGSPLEQKSFEGATGSAEVSLERFTLEYLGQLLPESDIDVGGEATVKLKLSRSSKDVMPDAELSGQTNGLRVSVARKDRQPLVISGVELLLGGTHEGRTGNTTASASAVRGPDRLLAASADMNLDLGAALSGAEPLEQQLLRREILGKIVVSQNRLEDLPGPLRVPGLRGAVRLEGTLRGSLSEPVGSVALRATDVQLSAGDRAEPMDFCGTAEYAKSSGAFSVGAEAFLPAGLARSSTPARVNLRNEPCSGQRVANLRASGVAPFSGVNAGPSWTGTVLASLEGLPLATIPALADARVSGTVTGRILLDRSSELPVMSSQLQLQNVRMDRLDVGNGSIELRTNANRGRAQFAIQRGAATATGDVSAGLSWASDLPALDPAQPIDTQLSAQGLEASLLSPVLGEFVSELRGTLQGQVRARLEPLREGETDRKVGNIGGNVTLRDGSFVLTALGFRLREVNFQASARDDGETTLVEIPNITATALAKSQNMSANASFRLSGFELVSGSAGMRIRDLPLVVDGITRANADADVRITIQRKPEKMFAEVYFDRLDAQLPNVSSRDLTALGENENVRVLQPLEEPSSSRGKDALPWHFVIHLGPQARVARGVLLNLPIQGDPNVVLARDVGVTGSVALRQGGTVQMLGKIFLIEGGGVFFDTADPKDPRLDIGASWRAPDGNALFVRVTGTLGHPKLTFDRSESEAWALLLGGDANAIGVSALDTLLSDTPLARVQLRSSSADQDSNQPGASTYTAAYRATDTFVVEGNYQDVRSGSNPNQGGNVSAAVELRFRPPWASDNAPKNWSLRTEVGTIGTGVDLLYQYRY